MIRSRLSRFTVWTLGLCGLLASAGTSRAEYFQYTTTVTIDKTPGSYTPNAGTTISNPAGNQTSTFATGLNTVILLAQNSGGQTLNGLIGTDINPVGIDANSQTSTVNEQIAFNFSATVTISNFVDPAGTIANGTGSVTLTGRLGGNLGANAVNIQLLSFAINPSSLTIGTDTYTVSANNFASPGLSNNGAISIHVQARPVPEPASLALLFLGTAGAFGVYRRRNRMSA